MVNVHAYKYIKNLFLKVFKSSVLTSPRFSDNVTFAEENNFSSHNANIHLKNYKINFEIWSYGKICS